MAVDGLLTLSRVVSRPKWGREARTRRAEWLVDVLRIGRGATDVFFLSLLGLHEPHDAYSSDNYMTIEMFILVRNLSGSWTQDCKAGVLQRNMSRHNIVPWELPGVAFSGVFISRTSHGERTGPRKLNMGPAPKQLRARCLSEASDPDALNDTEHLVE